MAKQPHVYVSILCQGSIGEYMEKKIVKKILECLIKLFMSTIRVAISRSVRPCLFEKLLLGFFLKQNGSVGWSAKQKQK